MTSSSASDGDAARYHVTGEIDPRSSHGTMLRLIWSGARVLDVGCASGFLARELVRRGCQVVGIEYDPELAALAREHCEEVIEADLETIDLKERLGDRRFDVVVCGDILEHLRAPEQLLDALRHALNPGGHLVVSVPNIAHGSVRLALLTGKFDYTDTGLLDRTHVRFYTRETLLEMLAAGGFTTVHVEPVLLGVRDAEVKPAPQVHLPDAVTGFVDHDPTAIDYQYVALAYPTEALDGAGLPALIERLSPLAAENATLRIGRDGELAELRATAEQAYLELLAARDELIRSEKELARHRAALEAAERSAREESARTAALETTLAEIYGSRLWLTATRYRQVVERIRQRSVGR
ncbi:MAG TPA: class I SAM-dependent methyltransferase [Mycobacteriales bacterium]|nr:class I SAM-dependent methyltransferase [Mycobacteriales bacterium]